MAGFENNVMLAKNLNFDPAAPKPHLGILNAAGKLPIGTGNISPIPEVLAGSLTSPGGTITIGYSSPNITLDLSGGTTAIDSIAVQTGTTPVVPTAAGLITFNGVVVAAGTNPVRTNGFALNSMSLDVQISQAVASTDATRIGLSNFNSTHFTVDANGFVSSLGAGFVWTDQGSNITAAVNHGYFITAAVTITLPAAPSIGDVIKFIVVTGGSLIITANAGQTITIGNQVSSAAGTLTNTLVGDAIELIYRSTDTGWKSLSSVGNWGVA